MFFPGKPLIFLFSSQFREPETVKEKMAFLILPLPPVPCSDTVQQPISIPIHQISCPHGKNRSGNRICFNCAIPFQTGSWIGEPDLLSLQDRVALLKVLIDGYRMKREYRMKGRAFEATSDDGVRQRVDPTPGSGSCAEIGIPELDMPSPPVYSWSDRGD